MNSRGSRLPVPPIVPPFAATVDRHAAAASTTMLSLRAARLVSMPLLATAFRAKPPPLQMLALAPLARMPAELSVRNLHATPRMEADRTVVSACAEKIEAALAPQVASRAEPPLCVSGRWGTVRSSAVQNLTAPVSLAAALQKLEVKGAFDDPNGSHIMIECVSEAFEGKRSLARQQMVFKAIWDEMQGQGGNVHAVDQMILKAPSEVGK
eukprot:6395706-Prymnesium_polylepis.1